MTDKKEDIFKLRLLGMNEVRHKYSVSYTKALIKRNRSISIFLAVVLIGMVFFTSYFFYQRYKNKQMNLPNQAISKEEAQKLVKEIEKIIKLPPNEEPSIATVTDIARLRDQTFFADGQNGDKVLIYANAKKLILYDPVTKKIVNEAPLVTGINPQPTPQPQARIVIRNGTTVAGLAFKVESAIRKGFPDVNIVDRDNAVKKDYNKTIVIALNDSAKDAASNLAKSLNFTISGLPTGENKVPNADIVIILGKDEVR